MTAPRPADDRLSARRSLAAAAPVVRCTLSRDAAGSMKGSFAAALALSLALHGAALAGALWLFPGQGPAAEPPRQAVVAMLALTPEPAAAPSSRDAALPQDAVPPKPIVEPKPAIPSRAIEQPTSRGLAAPLIPAASVPEPKPMTPNPRATLMAPPETMPSRETPTETPQAQPPAVAAVQQANLGDTAPSYGAPGLVNPPPRYPWLARQRGEEGRVVLRVAVDAEGRAVDVAVARTSGHERLDHAAAEAVRRWRFRPAQSLGRTVAGTVEVPVSFRLSDGWGAR